MTWSRKPAVAETHLSSDTSGFHSRQSLVELIDEALDRLVERLRSAGADEAEKILDSVVVLKRLREELSK